jgi:hypothetical protein
MIVAVIFNKNTYESLCDLMTPRGKYVTKSYDLRVLRIMFVLRSYTENYFRLLKSLNPDPRKWYVRTSCQYLLKAYADFPLMNH